MQHVAKLVVNSSILSLVLLTQRSVLLCSRMDAKQLTVLQFDGLEAVNKIQDGSKYDLILMDIIMPNLDGVSACHLIRQFDRTPIIAMTSNIRSDDIQLYFQHGT